MSNLHKQLISAASTCRVSPGVPADGLPRQVLAAGVVSVLSPAAEEAAAVGVGTLAKSCNTDDSTAAAAAATKESLKSHRNVNGESVEKETASFASRVSTAAAARAAAASKKGRWSDLETWLDCSLSALEACTRCVNWASSVGYVGGLAYVRLLSLVLRLLCPLTAAEGSDDASTGASAGGAGGDITGRFLFGGGGSGDGGGRARVQQDGALDGGKEAGGEGSRDFSWARLRLAQVVDDLMWRLREGLPGRDVRLRLLQVRKRRSEYPLMRLRACDKTWMARVHARVLSWAACVKISRNGDAWSTCIRTSLASNVPVVALAPVMWPTLLFVILQRFVACRYG